MKPKTFVAYFKAENYWVRYTHKDNSVHHEPVAYWGATSDGEFIPFTCEENGIEPLQASNAEIFWSDADETTYHIPED